MKIVLEDNVQVGPGSLLVCDTHQIGDRSCRAVERRYLGIRIKSGTWFGANVTVLPGVTIAEDCVIGAGALVNRDTAPNGLYVGDPARRIRDLD